MKKSPQQVVKWRAAQEGETPNSSTISRATAADMVEFSQILKDKYGYDTGSFTNFPADITNLKLLGRIDWNIDKGNKLSVRYNFTNNKTLECSKWKFRKYRISPGL